VGRERRFFLAMQVYLAEVNERQNTLNVACFIHVGPISITAFMSVTVQCATSITLVYNAVQILHN